MRTAGASDPEFGTLIITGGSSGIGLSLLQGFARRQPNARCINISRSAPAREAFSHPYIHIQADLRERKQVARAIEKVLQELSQATGPILLINNSGIGQHEVFQHASPDQTLDTIDLNISGTVQLTHGLLPKLIEHGGCIATVSSTSAFQPTPVMATYGASKAFLMHWTLALGEDLKESAVRTMILCPGGTQTPFLSKAGFDKPVRSYWPLLTVQQVSDSFYKALARKRSVVVPGLINCLVAALSKTAPIRWSTRVAGHIMRRAKDASS